MEKMVLFLVSVGISMIVVGFIVGVATLYNQGVLSSKKEAVRVREEFYNNNQNPVLALSTEEAIEEFDESYIEYLMYGFHANELHNSPLSFETPKIEIYIDESVFSIEIIGGKVFVDDGPAGREDIIIRTSKAEIVKMLQERGYIMQSFNEGRSKIEVVESKTKLFSKGYLDLYEKLTGNELKF